MKKDLLKLQLLPENGNSQACMSIVQASLKELQAQETRFLTKAEQQQLASYKVDRKKHHYLLGRYSAKVSIEKQCSCLPLDCSIESGVFNQPIIMSKTAKTNAHQVSIAHSADIAVAVVSKEHHPIAVDLEKIDLEKSKIILAQMTKNDLSHLKKVPPNIRLNLGWTVKEALSKILKCGLMTPFSLMEIDGCYIKENHFECTFENFSQYRSHSWQYEDTIITLVMPKNTRLKTNIAS